MLDTLSVLLVSFNFCRPDENADPYGISCLITAFNNSPKKHEQDKIDSLVIDLEKKWTLADIYDQIVLAIKNTDCNVLAFSNFIWADRFIRQLLPLLKRDFPQIKIMMGGPMVCGTEDYLAENYPQVDLFTVSYGEQIFSDLRAAFSRNQRVIEGSLDLIELYSPYLMKQIPLREGMSVRMETRRGCKFNCSYCRHRNANCHVYSVSKDDRILEELKLFTKNKVGKINVLDPFFNDIYNPDMTKANGYQFLKACRELGVNAKVSVQIRPEMINQTYLELASQMKNVIFEIGIQSLDKKVYPHINRGNDKAQAFVMNKLQEVKNHGIDTEITLIYGLPNQTCDSFKNDVFTLKNMGFTDIKAFPLQIYPATEIIKTYKNYGLKVRNVEPYGILEVYDNPGKDFAKMAEFAADQGL